MKLCHARDSTPLVHAVTPSDDNPAGQTLCGLPVKHYLPFLPVASFGNTKDMDWCKACVRERRYLDLPEGCRNKIPRKLTAETRRKIVELEEQGLSVTKIMKEVRLARASVYKALNEAGVAKKQSNRRMFDIHEYRKSHTAEETSQHFGVTVRSVYSAVKKVNEKLGIKRGANGQYDRMEKASSPVATAVNSCRVVERTQKAWVK